MKPKKIAQYSPPVPKFDAYDKDGPIQEVLGSRRSRQRQEAAYVSSTNFKDGESGWRLTPSDILNVPLIIRGSAAPTVTPLKVGNIFIDTVADKIYFATGTASSADWTAVN